MPLLQIDVLNNPVSCRRKEDGGKENGSRFHGGDSANVNPTAEIQGVKVQLSLPTVEPCPRRSIVPTIVFDSDWGCFFQEKNWLSAEIES